MKYLGLTSQPDSEAAPEAFRLIASSSHVNEARLLALSLADSQGATGLFAIDGDRQAFVRELEDVPEFVSTDISDAEDGWFYLLATLGGEAAPVARTVFEMLAEKRLVVVPPVTYRNGTVHARLVGEIDTVGTALEQLPKGIEVEVNEVGEGGTIPDAPAAGLSDRQREAVMAALELGYYDQPRQATHAEVAEALDCAPSTASEHLRKAEATLVRAVMTR